MDTWLIFHDFKYGDGGTEDTSVRALLDLRYCAQVRSLGKSGLHKNRREIKSEASADEMYMKSLPRKSSSIQHIWNRTANRNRRAGRVDQDERVKDPQGTRQKSIRNFGIRIASCKRGRSESLPGDCLSKTQLPAKS